MKVEKIKKGEIFLRCQKLINFSKNRKIHSKVKYFAYLCVKSYYLYERS